MFEIHPSLTHSHPCPHCRRSVGASGFVLAAGRSLGSGTCAQCGRKLLFDLPVGFGILYPACLDQASGEVFGPEVGTWFQDRLRRAWIGRGNESQVLLRIEVRRAFKRIVLCNCLDDVYGHVLFKLFGVQPYLASSPDTGVAVLIPSNVRHLVPQGVSEVWEVDLPLPELTRWNERLGARLWADKASTEMARIGGRSPGPLDLTPTEQEVADLVGNGLTNREVANALFLSVSTVEANLRRIYRKLGVRSRTELSRKLSER